MLFNIILSILITALPCERISDLHLINSDTLMIVYSEEGAYLLSSPGDYSLITHTDEYFLISGIKIDKKYIFQTIGSGLIFIEGNSLSRRGFNICGPHQQYGTSLSLISDKIYLGFSDGLFFIEKGSADPHIVRSFSAGPAGYILDLQNEDNKLVISTLEGLYLREDDSFIDLHFPEKYSHNKVIQIFNDSILLGSDSGLWLWDKEKWNKIIPLEYTSSIFIDNEIIYVSDFNSLNIISRKNFNLLFKYNTLQIISIIKFRGKIIFGSVGGLFVDTIPTVETSDVLFDSTFPINHCLIDRPFQIPFNILPDQTYLFGSTFDSRYRVHKGNDYNNPNGTPILSGSVGTVISSGTGNHNANYITVNYGKLYKDWTVRGVYVHLNQPSTLKSNDIVRCGDTLGFVGHTGRATNDHLHFEIRLTINGRNYGSVNPSLWTKPVEGTGIIAGRITEGGSAISGLKIYGCYKPWVFETPFMYAETYGAGVMSDPELNENFVISDVLPGLYLMKIEIEGLELDSFTVRVRQNGITWVEREI